MAGKNNSYEKKAQRASFAAMANGLDTKGNIKNTLIETGKDLLIGVIGGGLVGSAIGKPSLGIGILATGVGHYIDSRLLTLAGIGMMAANGFQTKTVSGTDEGMEGIKDRVMAFKDSFSQKLYLDKILKKKDAASTAGFGNLQYFNYANEVAGLAALNNVEDQIENSAMARLQMNGGNMGAADDGLPAMEGTLAELSDVSDYNL
ncbi:MAG: hypothetical protein J7621_22425 [Niastella sp.]|nr:hypothetical protein [Niastella sp.]